MKNTQHSGRDYGHIAETHADRGDEAKAGWWWRLNVRYKNWRLRHRARRSLRSFNDAQLRDIGLSRNDLPYRDERK